MGFGTAADVIFRFVFILIVPYFLNDPLYMGARFAFVMAVLAAISVVFVVLCVPEVSPRPFRRRIHSADPKDQRQTA
jgi:Na+/melibiose symporter-like transporter